MSNCGSWTCPLLWVELCFVPDKALHFQFTSWYSLSIGQISDFKSKFLQAAFRCLNALKGFFEDWLLHLFNLYGVLYLMPVSYHTVCYFSFFYRHKHYWKIIQWNWILLLYLYVFWMMTGFWHWNNSHCAHCSVVYQRNWFVVTALTGSWHRKVVACGKP